MRIKIIIRISIVCIFIVLVGAEFYLRRNWKKFYMYSQTPLIYQYDSTLGFTYKPGAHFYKSGKKYTINRQGFIGNDFTVPKESNVFRIAILGSCIISGALDYTDYSNCCTTVQKLFNKNNWNVEIYNCGMDGDHRKYDIFKSIEYKCINLNPDLIICEDLLPFKSNNNVREIYRDYILEYSKGDTVERGKIVSMVNNIHKFNLFFKLIDNVYIFKVICFKYISNRKKIQDDFSKKTDADYNNPKDEYLASMLELYIRKKNHPVDGVRYKINNVHHQIFTMKKSIELTNKLIVKLKSKNIDFYYFTYNTNKIKRTEELKSHFLLISPAINHTMLYDNPNHFNALGNKTFGEELYRVITENKLVPEQFHIK